MNKLRILSPFIRLASCVSSTVAGQYEHVLGETYDVIERHPTEEIHELSSKVDWKEVYAKATKLDFPTPTITRAKRNNEFVHEVLNTIDMDVRNPTTGEILYPKGYTFNPLAHLGAMQLPTFFIISTHEKDIEWLKSQDIPTNSMILAVDDPIELSKLLSRKVMLLKDDLREKLNVNFYPARVSQVGYKIKVNEYHVSL